MNLWKLSIKNMLYKPMSTFLSILLLAFSIGLIAASFHLEKAFEKQIQSNLLDIDMVIGAKGSPLQLVLSSVLHIDNPTGNINYQQAQGISRSALIKSAVPISYGDNYKGFRIVGTTERFLTVYHATLQQGSIFKRADEVIVGALVAEKLHIKVGDKITSSHGLLEDATETHEDKLTVTGILKPVGNVSDQLVLTPLETVWKIHEHAAMPLDESEREITAMLVTFKSPMGLLQMPRRINTTTNMQAALPKFELERLFGFMGIGFKTVAVIGLAVLLVSGLSIFINLYRIVSERKYELALMRTYGASRLQLLLVIFFEGLAIGILGMLFGMVLSKAGLYSMNMYVADTYKYQLEVAEILPEEGYLAAGVFILIFVATLLAVIPVLRMNVSKILADEN